MRACEPICSRLEQIKKSSFEFFFERGFFLLFFTFMGTSDGIAGDGGAKGVRLFLPFYFLESVWGKTCETSVISKHTDEIIILQLTVH